MLYHIFLKHNCELTIKIFEFLILISVLNVMKYFNHSEVYDGIKICSQLRFFTYESINTCDNVETSCLHSDLVFSSISKLQYRNSNSYFNLLLLHSGDISFNPGPPLRISCNLNVNGVFLIREGFILSTSTLIVCYLKLTKLEILLNNLMQQL